MAKSQDAIERAMWRSLVVENTCPQCNKKGELYKTASGGLAENWLCDNCQTKFWLCPQTDGENMGCKILK